MKIEIREVKTKVSEAGHSSQLVRLQVVSRDGRRFWKEASVPLSSGQVPYSPGRYEFSDSSFYVNRGQGVAFFPRLAFVADLEDDSGPGEGLHSSAVSAPTVGVPEASAARSGSFTSDVPF